MIKVNDLKKINHYWQVLTFMVLLEGYITFSFYSNMNGLPFIQIDFPLIIGLGLIVFIYVSFVYFISMSANTFLYKYIYSLVLITSLNMLNTFNILTILMIISGLYVANGMHLYIQTESDGLESLDSDKDKKDKKFIYFFVIPFSIIIILTLHWTISLLFFATLFFMNELQLNYKIKKTTNYFGLLLLILLFPYLISLYINSNGLLPLNLFKQKVEFSTKEKFYSSIMVYQNTENIYFKDNNNTFSVNKNEIDSNIKYLDYIKDNENLINKFKGFIND